MITVAGFNTAIDHLFLLDALVPGAVQRASRAELYPGGKGLHVAQTIAALGERVQLVGLTDVAHRNLITRRMAERGVLFHGVEIDQPLRTCIAVREREGRFTELLSPGPEVSTAVREQLLRTWWRCAEESELLVMSGSLPRGFGPDTYALMVRQATAAGVPSLVDASGEALQYAADSGAHLLKPNRDEASSLANGPVRTLRDAADVARALYARGIAQPVVTMGAEGAVAFDGRVAWHASIALAHSTNTVGSGDCLLAGFAVALKRGEPMHVALRLGVACGAANAMDEETGYVRRECVDALLGQVQMQRLEG
ncbi:1-phosphofructokinase [Dyella jiangningensis]|uniref:1-phosphofructokinase family hexose kinase n=1 Tax=Dyella jiangningensis TaxID=1379159 RepID=UPI000456436A|nr:1-phosphofructokinase family hexose kinase [Dyella jiangningensis]AHX14158.1 1-phosphofructokinase [Dyella jiangningensis]MDG2536165.1 1-phosphofructokinase family hexose kinase [Dyella jiangningensis]